MKTIIISIAAVLLSLTSVCAQSNDKLFKNTVTDNDNRTQTTTIYKSYSGKNGKILSPFKQIELRYDDSGNISERLVSVWNNSNKTWDNTQKYSYVCNAQGEISLVQYTAWNSEYNTWNATSDYLVYQKDAESSELYIDHIKGQSVLSAK